VRGSRVVLAVLATALGLTLVLAPGKSWAPVPPRDCGMLEVRDKRFNVKSDRIRCRKARRYAKSYLRRHDAPSGYSCRDYGRETKIKFRCSKGVRVLFAIRR
jgi:hypothetical protein